LLDTIFEAKINGSHWKKSNLFAIAHNRGKTTKSAILTELLILIANQERHLRAQGQLFGANLQAPVV